MSRKEYIHMLVGFRERDKDVNRRDVGQGKKKYVNSEPGEYVFGIVKGSWRNDAIK